MYNMNICDVVLWEVCLPLCYQRQRQNVPERWFYTQHQPCANEKNVWVLYTTHTNKEEQQYFHKLELRGWSGPVGRQKNTGDVNPPPPSSKKKIPHYLFQWQENLGWTVPCTVRTRACSVCTGQQQIAADGFLSQKPSLLIWSHSDFIRLIC